MESLIKTKITDHLDTNNLLNHSQHGFMANKSTTTNLLEFFTNITKDYDNGEPIDLLYLDFSKAFDKVPHQRLLIKLEAHGITGRVRDWIANWLSNRRQRTVLNGGLLLLDGGSEWCARAQCLSHCSSSSSSMTSTLQLH